jgi:hypothetical protein
MMTVVVSASVTPTFNQVAAICSGQALSALPTTSTNGLTGTWSPALNNTLTTTYTFTPSASLCATTQNMTIVVNPNITPTFTQVAPICQGQPLAALPNNSNNGITGTWSPAINNLQTTTYTFTPSGSCSPNQTMTIVVNPSLIPTFNQVPPTCLGEQIAALPTTSNNGITGTWSPALNNTATTTYTFTPNAGQCAAAQTLAIVINQSTTPTFTTVNPICIGGDLAELPNTSNNGFTGIWSPALNNQETTTYTFTFTKTGYGTRYYTTNLTEFSDENILFALLPTTQGRNIEFQVYQTDQTTLYTNTSIRMFNWNKNGNRCVS